MKQAKLFYKLMAVHKSHYLYAPELCPPSVPPRWTVEPTDKQFAQGSDGKVDCKADGFPKPQIGWKKAPGGKPENYQDLDTNVQSNVKVIDGALVMKNIQKENEGYYLCKSTNGIGRGLSAVIYISVQGILVIHCFFLLQN